ncbi:MAG TPA: 5'/3'-nucleotidase SurE [Acidimicrobiia bacterium]
MLRRLTVVLAIAHLAIAILAAAGVGHALGEPDAAARYRPKTLRVLVTNDDGVGAAGIDVMVEALVDLPRVKVTVVAPAENQSGTGDRTSPAGVDVATAEASTAGGYPATAVSGTPADSVIVGLEDVVAKPPHLVVSGINEGQNLGPALDISGTVGAARTAAIAGVPALAASQGLGDDPDNEVAADLAVDWVKAHRKRLVKGTVDADEFANLNVPTCTTGSVRGLVEVRPEPTGELLPPADCSSTLEDPPTDVVAFENGFATLSEIPTG